MMLRIPDAYAFLFCSIAVALAGCGSDAATPSAGNTEVSFYYSMPVSSCAVHYEVYRTGTTPPPDSVPFESGDCHELVPDDQDLIWAVLDLPPGE